MHIVVGLGNPGTRYAKTRHNVGFLAIEYLRIHWQFSHWKNVKKIFAAIATGDRADHDIILLKPDTFMNASGKAVAAALAWHPSDNEHLIVIHDDIDVPLGAYKIQKNRGAAGHNGVQSIIDALHTKNFTRIRIGIHPVNAQKVRADSVVLTHFTKNDLAKLQPIFEGLTGAIEHIITS